jgi:hypothetical protein
MRTRWLPVLSIVSLLPVMWYLLALETHAPFGSLTPEDWLAGRYGFCVWVRHDYVEFQVVHDFTGERQRFERDRQAMSGVDDLRIADRVSMNAMTVLAVGHADYSFGPYGSNVRPSFRYKVLAVHVSVLAAVFAVLPVTWLARALRRRAVGKKSGFPVDSVTGDGLQAA